MGFPPHADRDGDFEPCTDISGHVEANTAAAQDQAAQDQSDLASAERGLAEAEAFRAATDKTMRNRAIAAKQAA